MQAVCSVWVISNCQCMFCRSRKDDAFSESLAAKAKAVGGGDSMSDVSDADAGQLLQEMVWPQVKLLSYASFMPLVMCS